MSSVVRRAVAIVQPLFVGLALVLLAMLLRSQWDALKTYAWHVRPGWVLASGLCIIVAWLFEVRLWQRLLASVGGTLPYGSAVRIWFASAIVRYVPGNIWQPIGLTMRCGERGIRPEATLASLSLFNVIHLMAVGPIAAVYLVTWGRQGALSDWLGSFSRWAAVAVAIPVVCFVMQPQLILTMANVVLAKVGRAPLPLGLSRTRVVGLLGLSLAAWAFYCAGFSAFAAAMISPDTSLGAAMPHLIAAYPIAFATGFLSLVTPTGLVVREGMVYLMLGPVIGRANAIVVAIGMRVLEISLEAAVSLCALSLPAMRSVGRRDHALSDRR